MKKIIPYLGIFIGAFIIASSAKGQNPVWTLPSLFVGNDGVNPVITTTLPTPTTTAGLGYSGQTSDYASNAIYDNYGELVFFIVDSKLYDDEG